MSPFLRKFVLVTSPRLLLGSGSLAHSAPRIREWEERAFFRRILMEREQVEKKKERGRRHFLELPRIRAEPTLAPSVHFG